jgi:hypothetical protein
MEGKSLKRITTQTSVVDFIATTLREDLDPNDRRGGIMSAKQLNRIEVSSGNGSNVFCESWNFNYSYFIDATRRNRSEYKRLKLDSVQQNTCTSQGGGAILLAVPPYRFFYYGKKKR